MFSSRSLSATIVLSACALLSSRAFADGTFKMMTYNVQNMFDAVDSPDTDDTEFTPNGAQKYTDQVINDKLHNLGEVIASENPSIVTMTEVENQGMVERLVATGLPGLGYTSILAGPSDDSRGIRNAVISKFPIVDSQSHRVWRDSWKDDKGNTQKTRDILEVTLRAGNSNGKDVLVTVLANHWPSRAGGAVRNAMRLDVAQQMEAITQDILAKNPDRLVISAGDFNDELKDASISQGLHLVASADALANVFAGSFFAIDSTAAGWADKDKGTFFYKADNSWDTIDHLMIAEGSDLSHNQAVGFHYVENSFERVAPEKFRDPQNGAPVGCEINPKFHEVEGRRGNNCPFGASDHFPIAATFELR